MINKHRNPIVVFNWEGINWKVKIDYAHSMVIFLPIGRSATTDYTFKEIRSSKGSWMIAFLKKFNI